MSFRQLPLAAAALAALATSAAPALAGGQCFAHVRTPPVVGTVQQAVLVRPETQVAHTLPAVVRTVAEQVLLSPERSVAHVVPPVLRQVGETVLVAPASRRWQVSYVNGQEIGCFVDVPAAYATRLRTVEVEPARTVYSTIPAVYGTRLRTVVDEPSRTVFSTVPAQYGSVARQVLVSPGSDGWQPIGAQDGCY